MVPLPGSLRVATHLLVGTGLVALYLAGLLGLPGLAATLAVAGASWWTPGIATWLGARRGLGRAVTALAAAVALVDLVWLAETALDGFVHLLVLLILARLCALRIPRDVRVVSYLSFFMLVAASASPLGVGFLFVFVAFAMLATWVLLFQQVASEAERGRHRAVIGSEGAPGPSRGLVALGLAAALASVAMAALLFFVIPRVGQAALPLRMRVGPLVSGFSDRVDLGHDGEIEADATVIMRVHIAAATGDPRFLPDLRWRGMVFDHFDGQAWTVGPARRVATRRSPPGEFHLDARRGSGALLVQEIYLEPLGTEVIFAAPRILRLDLRADRIAVDDMESVSVMAAAARLHYTVVSEVGDVRPGAAVGRERLGGGDRARYLQLPPVPARIGHLARSLTAASRGPEEAALRLTGYLSQNFEYTLSLARQTRLDPLEEFLFVRRSGNCEYFAAALAVMLRSLGIPARVVGGFQRGDWNEYGRYFMVRLRDAHAWVEAHVEGVGWITLDPSPRQAGVSGRSALGLYLDALRMRWYRYVINWSLRDQIETALSVRHQALTWRPWPAQSGRWNAPATPGTLLLAAAGAAALVAVIAWGAGSGRAERRHGDPVPRFYARALAVLARRGVRPRPGETAREFCERVRQVAPAAGPPLGRITDAYERSRFGGRPPTPDEAIEIDACLRALRRRSARGDRPPGWRGRYARSAGP
jgi:transglutaminase-like putative cysteine protease